LRNIIKVPSDHPIPNGPSPELEEYWSEIGGLRPLGPVGNPKFSAAARVPVLRSTLKLEPEPETDPPPEGRFRTSFAVPLGFDMTHLSCAASSASFEA
jgi:hypothetical protein